MQKYICKDDLYVDGTDGDYLWAEPRTVYLASDAEARIAELDTSLSELRESFNAVCNRRDEMAARIADMSKCDCGAILSRSCPVCDRDE